MGFWQNATLIALTAIVVTYAPNYLFDNKLPVIMNGTVSPGFEDVIEVFRSNFESGLEPEGSGSAFSAYYNGDKVIDIWGGHADGQALQQWKEATMTSGMSITKGMVATCIAILVDRGLMEYNQTVAHYWPEFAQNGKDNITVRVLLNHEAGLPIVSRTLSMELYSDFEELGRVLAASTPIWNPGTARGYHLITWGPLASQLLYRVDPKHRTVGQFFREEIAEPYDIDFYIGLPLEENYRTARFAHSKGIVSTIKIFLKNPRTRALVWSVLTGQSFLKGVLDNCGDVCEYGLMNDPYVRAVERPSSLGIGTARALAKVYNIVLNGVLGPDGKPLLSSEMVQSFYKPGGTAMKDMVMGYYTRFNMGFGVYAKRSIDISFGHAGLGGQMALAQPTLNLTHAYITRHRSLSSAGDDPRWIALTESLIKCVHKIQASTK